MVDWWWLLIVGWLSVAATMCVVMWSHGRAETRRDWVDLCATLLWPLFLLAAVDDL